MWFCSKPLLRNVTWDEYYFLLVTHCSAGTNYNFRALHRVVVCHIFLFSSNRLLLVLFVGNNIKNNTAHFYVSVHCFHSSWNNNSNLQSFVKFSINPHVMCQLHIFCWLWQKHHNHQLHESQIPATVLSSTDGKQQTTQLYTVQIDRVAFADEPLYRIAASLL